MRFIIYRTSLGKYETIRPRLGTIFNGSVWETVVDTLEELLHLVDEEETLIIHKDGSGYSIEIKDDFE